MNVLVACWIAVVAAGEAPPVVPDLRGLSEVTFCLHRPPGDHELATLLARLPEWTDSLRLDRLAVPLAPATAGGDFAAQAGRLARLASALGAARLVVVTPPVGTVGWEASNNLAYLPLGGRPILVSTPQEAWLGRLAALPVATVALVLEGCLKPPSADELGAHLDALAQACAAAGRAVELWLPADLAATDPRAPALAALTAERLARLRAVTWLDTGALARQTAPARLLDAEAMPESGGVEPVGPTKATPGEVVEPSALRQDRVRDRLARLAALAPRIRLAVDLADRPREPIESLELARQYLHVARAAGFTGLVVRGRLDTPAAPVWGALLAALRPDDEPDAPR